MLTKEQVLTQARTSAISGSLWIAVFQAIDDDTGDMGYAYAPPRWARQLYGPDIEIEGVFSPDGEFTATTYIASNHD